MMKKENSRIKLQNWRDSAKKANQNTSNYAKLYKTLPTKTRISALSLKTSKAQ